VDQGCCFERAHLGLGNRRGCTTGACNALRNIEISAKKWGDTEIAERGRSVLVMRARYRSAGLTAPARVDGCWLDDFTAATV